jgi:hypothetical protein
MHPSSVHLVLKPFEPAALCFELKDHRMNRYHHVGSSDAKDFCLGASLSFFKLIIG